MRNRTDTGYVPLFPILSCFDEKRSVGVVEAEVVKEVEVEEGEEVEELIDEEEEGGEQNEEYD